jgi:hypothetical protein
METAYDVSFNTYNDYWLTTTSQCSNGFGPIAATATSVSQCERFDLIDMNGGDLVDGDIVAIRSHNSSGNPEYYWGASNQDLNAAEICGCSNADSLFYLYDQDCTTSGCQVEEGHKLVFQSTTTGKYIHAAGGGGADMDTSATSGGLYERLEIVFH